MECKIIAHGYEGPVVTDQFHQKKWPRDQLY